MKEFKLSEHRERDDFSIGYVYREEKIKEFIKLEGHLINECMRGEIGEIVFWKRRNKLIEDLK